MPRTYKPVAGTLRRKKYSDTAMTDAVDAVHQGMSQREASEKFDVPHGTLQDKLKGAHSLPLGGQPVFSEEEEIVIAKSVATLGDWGYPVDALEVHLMLKQYLTKRGRKVSKFRDNLPGKDWLYSSFVHQRRDIISQRMCQNICQKRAQVTSDVVGVYFDNLEATLAGVPPGNIINFDETNLTDDPGQKKCLYRRGCMYPERVLNSTKASTSIMFAGTASGELLHPYVVYKAEHLHDRWIQGGPAHVRYNRTRSGWFDSVCFTDWFMSVVVPYCRRLDGTSKKVLIGDNLASHFSADVIAKCEDQNIRFACLPPNSTHMCQPLDVCLYGPMKRYWRETLTEWKSVSYTHLTLPTNREV